MISIVIPAYNEEKTIGKCFDSLVAQKINREFEVILVNNNSTDNTVDIAKSYSNKLNLRIILQREKGRGSARKMGFSVAKGKLVASTDADTIVPPNWLEILSEAIENNSAIAVTGTCKIKDCNNTTNFLFNKIQPLCMHVYRIIFGHYWLSGFNFIVYHDIYLKSGGFNEKLNTQEDLELSMKVSKLGKIQFIANNPVIFSGRRFKQGLFQGLVPYLTTFISYFILKNEKTILKDIR